MRLGIGLLNTKKGRRGRTGAMPTEAARSCAYCNCKIEHGHNAQVDHIDPLSRGGPKRLANLIWCCGSCNAQKGHRRMHEWDIPHGDEAVQIIRSIVADEGATPTVRRLVGECLRRGIPLGWLTVEELLWRETKRQLGRPTFRLWKGGESVKRPRKKGML